MLLSRFPFETPFVAIFFDYSHRGALLLAFASFHQIKAIVPDDLVSETGAVEFFGQ